MVTLDLHGFVGPMLIEPCTPPHNPNYEYDLYIKWALAQAEAMEAEFVQLKDELVDLVRGGGDSFDALMSAAVRRAYRFARAHVVAVRLTTREAIECGETSSNRQAAMLVPGLEDGVAILGRLTGAPSEALRLVLRSAAASALPKATIIGRPPSWATLWPVA